SARGRGASQRLARAAAPRPYGFPRRASLRLLLSRRPDMDTTDTRHICDRLADQLLEDVAVALEVELDPASTLANLFELLKGRAEGQGALMRLLALSGTMREHAQVLECAGVGDEAFLAFVALAQHAPDRGRVLAAATARRKTCAELERRIREFAPEL